MASVKGKGNGGRRPGAGRPPGIKEQIRRYTQRRLTAAQMLDTLQETKSWKWIRTQAIKNKDPHTLLAALKYWRDRLEGQPAQSLQHMGEGGGVIKIELITDNDNRRS